MTVTALPLPAAPAAPMGTVHARTPDVVYVPAPEGAPTDQPRVFTAINAVMRDAMPVGKTQENKQQNYNFRGIDDVMSAMAGPLRTHGVFILPTIADHQQQRDGKMTRTLITMRYRVYGPAGDCLVAEVPGEAFDFADKATNKAQSAALKYLLFTLFMLPVDGRSIDDGDRHNPEPPEEHRAEQAQRQQQRRQQRQQGRQQPRRSNRAEPGPWENQGPQQGDSLSPQARQLLADAQAAPSPEAFAAVRARAEKSGAPADFLARLDRIDAEKRQAAQQGQQAPQQPQQAQQSAPQGEQAPPPSSAPKSPEAAAAEAENALRLAASRANLPTLDADFERVYGLPIAQAGAQQLDAFRAVIENGGTK